MEPLSPKRDSSGCFRCRQKKRRCDRRKPECRACQNVRDVCIYPLTPPAGTAQDFKVMVSDDHFLLSNRQDFSTLGFVNLTTSELQALWSKPESNSKKRESHDAEEEWWGRDTDESLLFQPSWGYHPSQASIRGYETAHSLMQYYESVISVSWSFDATVSNMFRLGILPRILCDTNALFFTVLALSAAELESVLPGSSINFHQLALCYKVEAIRTLQSCFHIQQQAEVNLLTCVLLSSLEIVTGKQAWLWHRQGAAALLESFPTLIEPCVASFATEYFRSRCILTQTATTPECFTPTSGPMLHKMPDDDIDPYVGCSVKLLSLINDISDLSLRCRSFEMLVPAKNTFTKEAQIVEHQLHQCGEGLAERFCYSLSKSVESFQLAALIYLQIACFGKSLEDASVVKYHHKLTACLANIITEHRRQMSPIWPLFIAGCACSSEEQRANVWSIFLSLKVHWPFHNIMAVKRAVWTVWQTRDHAKPSPKRAWQDWQETLSKFNWRLCLT